MSLPADSSCEGRVSLHFTQSGLSIPTAAGVVVERGSEYILTHTGPRELDGHPLGGVWVRVCFSSRLYYPFGKGPGQHIIWCLKIKKCENENEAGMFGAGIFLEGRNEEEETAEVVLGCHRVNRGPPRCPTSRTTARQRVFSHPPAPIASHCPTGISFPTHCSNGYASTRSRDHAHQVTTSLHPSSGCCFESHQAASRRFPRNTARVLS